MSGPFARNACDAVPAGGTLRPYGDHIVVEVIDFEWSDVLIGTYRGKPVRGTVVAAGPGRYPNRHERGERDGKSYHTVRESTQFRRTEVKPGDIVELGGLELNGYDAGVRVLMNGKLHVVCSEQWVAAVHEARA